MHILVLTHALPWHRPGGLERATWWAVDGLARRGHQVSVLTTPPPRSAFEAAGLAPGATHHAPPELDEARGRVRVFWAPGGGQPGHPSPGFWRAVAREVPRLWRGERSRLVGAQHPDVVLAVDTAAMLLRDVPFVLQLHGTLFSETTLHRGFAPFRTDFPLLRGLWRYKARLAAWPLFGPMMRRAAEIAVDSAFIRDLVAGGEGGAPSARLALLPLALGPRWALALRDARLSAVAPRAQSGLGGGAPNPAADFSAERPLRLLTVGRRAHVKGHEVVDRALAGLLDSGAEHVVWEMAGPPPDVAADLPRLAAIARPLGTLPESALAEAFGRADYLLNLEYNQPAFGLVALEALCAGCAPIVSDRGALPEVVGTDGEGGWILPAGRADLLRDRLERLYEAGPTAAQRQSLAAQCRSYDFVFERQIAGLEALLARNAR